MGFLKPDPAPETPVPTSPEPASAEQTADDTESSEQKNKKRKKVGKGSLTVKLQGTSGTGTNVAKKKGSGLSVGGK